MVVTEGKNINALNYIEEAMMQTCDIIYLEEIDGKGL